MESNTIKVGDLVKIRDEWATPALAGVPLRVTKVMPVNIAADPVSGGRGVKGRPDYFVQLSDEEIMRLEAGKPLVERISVGVAVPVDDDHPFMYFTGQIVRVAGPGWRKDPDILYVVMQDKGDKVRLVKLGGDDGRYFPGVPKTHLTLVRPTQIRLY